MSQPAKPMPRTVSVDDMKHNWDALVEAVTEGEDVIVESHGKPKAVVISPEAFEELRQARERQRREKALQLLHEIEASYDGRNDDLSDEQIDEIAVRAGRDINRAVAERLTERSREAE